MPEHNPERQLRDRRATRSAVMGVMFQGVYAVGQLLVMAVLFRRLDAERFGMWLMIYSLTAWLAFSKFGLQFVLYTSLGRHALTDRDQARAILTNAAGFVTITGSLAAVLLLTIGWWLPWDVWLNVSEPSAVNDATPVAVVALVMAAVAMPLMMGGHAMLASQRGDLTQGTAMTAQVVMVLLLLLGFWLDWSLLAFAVVVMCPPVIAGLAQWTIGLMTGVLPTPGLACLDRPLMGGLLSAGVVFMLLDIATIAMLQGGPIVLGHAVDPEAVVPYGAAYRLIGLMIAAVMMICYAYWPAYSEANQRQDIEWVRRGVLRSLSMVLLLCLSGGVVVMLVGRSFIGWWLGEAAVPTFGTLASACVFAVFFGSYAVLGSALSGLGRLRQQVVSACVMVIVFVIAGIYFAINYGAAGLYSGQALGACVGALMNGLFLHRVMACLRRETDPV